MLHSTLARLHYGHALWLMIVPHRCKSSLIPSTYRREPGPIYSYKRVKLGDVGYIRNGRFHLLFSAGVEPGSEVPSTGVPPTFNPLSVGPIVRGIRGPGYLRSSTVTEIGANIGSELLNIGWCVCTCSKPVVHSRIDLTQ